jgi:hypothetical protein
LNTLLRDAFDRTRLKPPQKYGGSHLLRHSLATDRYLCLVHPELRHRRLEGRQDVTPRTQLLTNSGALHSVLVREGCSISSVSRYSGSRGLRAFSCPCLIRKTGIRQPSALARVSVALGGRYWNVSSPPYSVPTSSATAALMGENEEATLRSLVNRFAHRGASRALRQFRRRQRTRRVCQRREDAVQCAVEIQSTLTTENTNLPPEKGGASSPSF